MHSVGWWKIFSMLRPFFLPEHSTQRWRGVRAEEMPAVTQETKQLTRTSFITY